MSGIEIPSTDRDLLAEVKGLLPDGFQLAERHKQFSFSANHVFSAVIKSAEVVVKPFRGEFYKDRADHEAVMMDIVKDCGVPTLQPTTLCLGRAANYLITRYEPDITPLDQAGLSELPEAELAEIASGVGETLNILHASGIVHGDFQIRNLFIKPEENIGVMDFERAELYDDPADPGYISGCQGDLSKLFSSFSYEFPSLEAENYELPVLDSYQSPLVGTIR
jgi:tRNA A-37 threonylcarbamoyl transferase component Bud32